MPKTFVLTLTGPDRIGFVDEVTGLLLERGGNVETSRMARLGGEFAVLMLVSMPTEQFPSLEGIIHEVAHYLSEHGISIESVDSECTPGSTSGVPLFAMKTRVIVPPSLSGKGWEAGLDEIGDRMNLDIRVSDLRDQ